MLRWSRMFTALVVAAAAVPAGAVQKVVADSAPIGAARLSWLDGGNLTMIASDDATSPGAFNAQASFWLPGPSAIFSAVPARYSIAAPPAAAADVFNGAPFAWLVQPGLPGHFAFIGVDSIGYHDEPYLPRPNLLRGDFTGAPIAGAKGGISANFTSLSGAPLSFSSPIAGFGPSGSNDFQITLEAIIERLALRPGTKAREPSRSVRSFRASGRGRLAGEALLAGGSAAVPEPENWGLIIVGFTMVGLSVRRRDAWQSVTA